MDQQADLQVRRQQAIQERRRHTGTLAVRVGASLLYDGRTLVKGRRFASDRVIGVPEQQARVQISRDIDELMLLDVNASSQGHEPAYDLIAQIAEIANIPFAYGGGIWKAEQAIKIIRLGADKIVLGEAAVLQPGLIWKIAEQAGSQAVVVSVDVRQYPGCDKEVVYRQGRIQTEFSPVEYARHVVSFGAGELLLQRVERDGEMSGLDVETIFEVRQEVKVPLIASSGAGSYEDILEAVLAGADAVVAGALWSFTDRTPDGAKRYLRGRGFPVRLESE